MSSSVALRAGPVHGTVVAPASKSVTHRALLLARQSTVPCTVQNPLWSADTRSTLSCLWRLGGRAITSDVACAFTPAPWTPSVTVLDCGNSGTTLRLLAGTVARLGVPITLDGDASLRARPNAALLTALQTLGATCTSKDGKAPLTIRGPLRSGVVRLPGAVSSQFASSLLLSLPFLAGDSTLHMDAPVASAPYLDVTLDVAQRAGLILEERNAPTEGGRAADADPQRHPGPTADADPQNRPGRAADADQQTGSSRGRTFHIPGGQHVRCSSLAVDGDWSSVAFPLAAAAVSGGEVTVSGLDPTSRQGDRAIVDLLSRFGATTRLTNDGAICKGGPLHAAGTIDMSATPDLFPALVAVAAASPGVTTFTGATSLRAKESDRIHAMAAGLAQMGIAAKELPDGLQVTGGRPRGARVPSLGDHRIHMAFCILGLAADGVTTVDDPASAAVSYPGFHEMLLRLGASVRLGEGQA